MFTYTDNSRWSNSAATHFILSFMMWAPVAALLFYVAFELAQIHHFLLAFSVSLIWGLLLYKKARTKIAFPTIEISDTHIVVNTPLSKRSVYNLDHIEGARFYWHILYFRHDSWPILIPLPRMPKEKRPALIRAVAS